ncbi:hypothetical protein FNU76_19570 [Chitinimonas arctica]|uniref:Phasin family protein n=1 Tax=Chitinimonas arctica TaxID=2594795 RepID=A0A516SJR5_9NEIS|nr:hypothetical protein [Chitinimonas arctica]QDQ28373.1 hypothetical protein FNU76_19570 [Chitinimonas arctica]
MQNLYKAQYETMQGIASACLASATATAEQFAGQACTGFAPTGWKTSGREMLRLFTDFSDAKTAMGNKQWCTQRDALDLASVGQSGKQLLHLQADMADALWESNLQQLRDLGEAATLLLDTLAKARDKNDLGLAALAYCTAADAITKQSLGQTAAALGELGPALLRWLQRSLAEAPAPAKGKEASAKQA